MRAATALLGTVQRGVRGLKAAVGSVASLVQDEIVRHPGGRRRLLIVAATILVFAYAARVLTYVLTTPEIGVRTAFTTGVNRFYPAFAYYPDGDKSLQPGDVIREVGGYPTDNWSQLLRAPGSLQDETFANVDRASFDALHDALDLPEGKRRLSVDGQRVVRVVFDRGDEAGKVAWCRFEHSPVDTLVPSVLWFGLKILLFAVGAVVFWKRPADRSAAQFFLFCTVSFGAYMGGYHWGRIIAEPPLVLVFMVCAVLLPAVSLHFFLLFPRPKGVLERHPRTCAAAVYGVPLLFLALLLIEYACVRWLADHPAAAAHVEKLLGWMRVETLLDRMRVETLLYFGVAALWYLLSISCLVHGFRTAPDATERNQVKWVLFGALAAVAPMGYSLYLSVADPNRFVGGEVIWPMFAASACVTVAFGVSITRYRLMQIDQFVSSGAVYFAASAAAGVLYYGLIAGLFVAGRGVGDGPSVGQALAAAGAALVLLAALDLVRGRLRRALDRHYRREKNQLDRTWQRMSEAIDRLVDPPALARRLLHTAANLLGAPRGAVYLRQGDPPLYRLADALGGPPALADLPPGCPLVEALRGPATVEARPGVADPAGRQLAFLGGALAHALVHEGQLLGLVVLGPRARGPYTAEDVNLLTACARVTVLALVSAEGHRTIDSLSRELQTKVDKIAEQQRRIFALQSQLTRRAQGRGAAGGDGDKAGDPAKESGDGAPPPSGELRLPAAVEGLVGSGPRVQQLLHLVRKVAASDSAVLLRGESGTGKELLARALHEHSPRAGKAFVTVHCAALSPTLLESELFGHVKGAFTDAIRDKVGRFEAADGGTLFLDEIGDVRLEVQVKLLRVLQEMTFERVGSSEPVKVDVRVVAATHQDLERLIREGRFREDLYYRLNVLPVHVPPLRERAEDVPELAEHFLRLYARRAGKALAGVDDDALAMLKAYPWPGNVRELENVLERAVVIADGPLVTAADLPAELQALAPPAAPAPPANWYAPPAAGGPAPAASFRAEREQREREQIVRALAAAGGNKAEAARALGMARSTLVSRLKRLGLN
jgi:transcriptional regulator with GAF, ATPase, and Fis domain